VPDKPVLEPGRLRGNCGGNSDTGTGFSSGTSVFLCHPSFCQCLINSVDTRETPALDTSYLRKFHTFFAVDLQYYLLVTMTVHRVRAERSELFHGREIGIFLFPATRRATLELSLYQKPFPRQ
jgi:hypothetical protein